MSENVVRGVAMCGRSRAWIVVHSAVRRWRPLPPVPAGSGARANSPRLVRSRALDPLAVDVRKIERDLHDGAQARLVSVAMNLGIVEDLLETDPAAARRLLAETRASARTAMTELRHLVRGVLPPVLADRGLGEALRSLALATPIPVDLQLRISSRLASPLEATAYFTVAEAIANAVKHSRARRITVSVGDAGGLLRLRVVDDGYGGADPARGTGLRGMEQRVEAMNGALHLTSPAGGPTLVEAEFPCAR